MRRDLQRLGPATCPQEALADVALELHRVTRPGGTGFHRIDFRNLERGEPLQHLCFTDEQYRLMYQYRRSYTNRHRLDDVERIFRSAGFAEVRCETSGCSTNPRSRDGCRGSTNSSGVRTPASCGFGAVCWSSSASQRRKVPSSSARAGVRKGGEARRAWRGQFGQHRFVRST
jgi:hypothetical protein